MKQFGITLALMFLVGCTPVMISSSDMWGGVQKEPKWGIVKYNNFGTGSFLKESRDRVKKIMVKYCQPLSYQVLSAEEQGWGFFIFRRRYVYIRFQCVERRK